MALKVLLFSVRPSKTRPSDLERTCNDYLARCGPAFAAEGRVVKTEAAVLSGVTEERRGAAAAFWMGDRGGRELAGPPSRVQQQPSASPSVP